MDMEARENFNIRWGWIIALVLIGLVGGLYLAGDMAISFIFAIIGALLGALINLLIKFIAG